MSIIFQLFCAQDLKGLSGDQLEQIRNTVIDALYAPATLVHLKRRADEVFEQLTECTPVPTSIVESEGRPSCKPAAERKRVPLMFTRKDQERLNEEKSEILEWALECELHHSRSALEAIQNKANSFLSTLLGRPPIGPDAPYSHIKDTQRSSYP